MTIIDRARALAAAWRDNAAWRSNGATEMAGVLERLAYMVNALVVKFRDEACPPGADCDLPPYPEKPHPECADCWRRWLEG